MVELPETLPRFGVLSTGLLARREEVTVLGEHRDSPLVPLASESRT